jgi:two-component system, OmpR family, heavy metal sensor histidine kinase CusS
MKNSPRSIGKTLLWSLSVQMTLWLGLIAVVVYVITASHFAEVQKQVLESKMLIVKQIIRGSAQKGGESDVVRQLTFFAPTRAGTYLEIKNGDGAMVFRDEKPLPQRLIATQFEVESIRSSGGILRVYFAIDTSADAKVLKRIAVTSIIASVLGAVFVGVATFWRVRSGLDPLEKLAQIIQKISAKRLIQDIDFSQYPSELQPFITQFNLLMSRLDFAYAQLEGFNADVAHELRTPLTTLIGQTEVALSRERTPEMLKETLASNLEELHRVSAIVNDMLFLSQADRGAIARRTEAVSLAGLAHQVVEFHEALMDETGVRVVVDGDALLPVDTPLLKRAVSNLLGNALQFAQPGSDIRVVITSQHDSWADIAVENAGETIQAQHLPRLFDRFFRGDSARESASQHHGLGLAIVAAIARMHGGKPHAVSINGTTRIGFTLNSSTAPV